MIPLWLVQLSYIAACLAGMFAIFYLQRGRHRDALVQIQLAELAQLMQVNGLGFLGPGD